MSYIAELRVFERSAQYGKAPAPSKPERDPKVLDLRIEATTVQKLVEKLGAVVSLIDDE